MHEMSDERMAQMRINLHNHLLCPICGTPMVHDRIRGYHCHFEEHNERRREGDRKLLDAVLKYPDGE